MTAITERANPRRLALLMVVLWAVMGLIGFYYGGIIPFSVQDKVLDLIITLASFIFGVMGAWLALLYPEILKEIHKNQKELPEESRAILLRDFLINPTPVR